MLPLADPDKIDDRFDKARRVIANSVSRESDMQLAKIEALLAPVSADNSCGADLEYGDPAFTAFDRATQGKPEQQIGSTIIPAEEPDWKSVGRLAIELLGPHEGSPRRRSPDESAAAHRRSARVSPTG